MQNDIRPAFDPLPVVPRELPLRENPAAVYLASLQSPVSRQTMGFALSKLARLMNPAADAMTFPWERLRRPELLALRAHLVETGAPASARKELSAVKGVLKECWRAKSITTDDYHHMIDIEPVRGGNVRIGREVTREETLLLLEALAGSDKKAQALRDAAMIMTALGAGLRRGELFALEAADWMPEEPMTSTGQDVLKIRKGKGNKMRVAYLSSTYRDIFRAWMRLRGGDPGPIFFRLDVPDMTPIVPDGWRRTLARICCRAGVAEFAPHDLRRSFATELLERGEDVGSVRVLLGHSRTETTLRYDMRGMRGAKQAAANRLGPALPTGFRGGDAPEADAPAVP